MTKLYRVNDEERPRTGHHYGLALHLLTMSIRDRLSGLDDSHQLPDVHRMLGSRTAQRGEGLIGLTIQDQRSHDDHHLNLELRILGAHQQEEALLTEQQHQLIRDATAFVRDDIAEMQERVLLGKPALRTFVCSGCHKTAGVLHASAFRCSCGATSAAEVLVGR